MGEKQKILRRAAVFSLLFLLSGCVSPHVKPVSEDELQAMFPPRAVMKSGDYKGFLTKNSEALKACPGPDGRAAALFNLSFVHAYPKSPYYDPKVALQYISELVAGAPRSRFATEALVWRELLVREMRERNRARSMVRLRLKAKATGLQDKAAMQKDWQVDRQILEEQIRSKDETIKELTRQIKGSRKIDLEIEKKEKRLNSDR